MTKASGSHPTSSKPLLASLNLVAASVQLSIQSEESVLQVFGEKLSELGMRAGIGLLDESGEWLVFRTLGYSKKTLRSLARLEKLTGLSVASHRIKVDSVNVYREVIRTQKAILAPNSKTVIQQLLPKKVRKLADKVLNVFANVPVVYAPLITRGKTLGILNIAGPELTEADTSTVEAFAIHVSIALDNARLFSALQESEETYKTLVETSPDAVTVTDLEGTITYASQHTADLHGYSSPAELVGRSALMLISPKYHKEALANLQKTLDQGIIRDVEYTLLKANGDQIAGALNAAVIKGSNGEPKGFIAATRDVTDRKQAEEHYRVLVDRSLQGFVVVQDLRIVFTNNAFCEISGYSREELLAFSTEEMMAIIHPKDRERVWTNYKKRTQGEDVPLRYSCRGIRKNGSICWLEMVASRIEFDGRPAIQGAILDITERVRAEAIIKQSEEQRRDIYKNVSDILYFHDLEGNFIETNLFDKQELGYTKDEIIALGVPGVISEAFRHEFGAYIERVKKNGSAQGLMRIRTKDGRERILEYRNTLVSNDLGPIGVRGSARDITDRIRIERKLRDSEERYRLFLGNFQGIASRVNVAAEPKPLFFHGRVKEITGYAEKDLVTGKVTWSDLVHPEDMLLVKAETEKLRKTPNHTADLEYRIVRKDGEIRWVRELIQNISNGKDRPADLQATVYDITERRQAEELLRLSEERYRTLVENVSVGVYRSSGDPSGHFLHANPALVEMLGYQSIDDLMNTSIGDLYQDPRDRAQLLDELAARGFVRDRELRLKKRDGTPFWASINTTAKLNQEGEIQWMDGVIEDITERKRAEEQLLHDAFYDGLTGLPNRALLQDRLDRSIERSKRRQKYHCAVLFMDLDRFKVVNDSLGHEAGDELLISVARRLEGCLRSEDTVARLGGDEFVVLLEDIVDLSRVAIIANRIRDELNTPHTIIGHEVFTSASIGIVLTIQGYDQPSEVLRDADIAMYRAKLAGKDRYEIFDPAMRELALTRMQLEQELHQAMKNSEFRVHYQPILRMKTGALFGFEALVRWEHPERGVLPPGSFLPVMEETGLITQLGQWVLREACKKAKQWTDQHRPRDPLSISVNLSEREFAHPELVSNVRKALRESGLKSQYLILEITELVIMKDPEHAVGTLQELGELGVQIHLDDFGTGYSSLGKLAQFPIDKLKIDRAFVSQIKGDRAEAAIVDTILLLAKNLAMGAIAEGVETEQQYKYLQGLNCEFCQGFYIAKPMEASKAADYVKKALKGK
ncbi:MAG: PAS domain S-box protein [Anaerolineales bacterium]|jgi:diguanylate cyclase (GGDEF)-like protein/PAS domain S-box-containing protein